MPEGGTSWTSPTWAKRGKATLPRWGATSVETGGNMVPSRRKVTSVALDSSPARLVVLQEEEASHGCADDEENMVRAPLLATWEPVSPRGAVSLRNTHFPHSLFIEITSAGRGREAGELLIRMTSAGTGREARGIAHADNTRRKRKGGGGIAETL